MAKTYPVGKVVSGENQGKYIYVWANNVSLALYPLKDLTSFDMDFWSGERVILDANNINDIADLGCVEESANLTDVVTTGLMFGGFVAMAKAQLDKDSNHTLIIDYDGNKKSVIQINNFGYKNIQTIQANVLLKKESKEKEEKRKDSNKQDKDRQAKAGKTQKHLKELNTEELNNKKIDNQGLEKRTPTRININPNTVEPTLERIELFIEDEEWDLAKAYSDAGLDYFPKDYRLYKLSLLIDYKACNLESLIMDENDFRTNNNYKKAIRFGGNDFVNELETAKVNVEENKSQEIKEQELKAKKAKYEKACIDLSNAKTLYQCKRVAEILESLDGFEDSEDKIEECRGKAKGICLNEIDDINLKNQEIEANIRECGQKIELYKKEIKTIQSEQEQYIDGLGYDIKVKEKEIKEKKREKTQLMQDCLSEVEQNKKALREVQAKYSSVKLSLFKNKLKQEYLDEITVLERKVTEKEELYNNIMKEMKRIDKDFDKLVFFPKHRIRIKTDDINQKKQQIKEMENSISKNNSMVIRNNDQITLLKNKIDNNDLL